MWYFIYSEILGGIILSSAFQTKNLCWNLKYCIQRIRRGYCDGDLWEIDSWFLSLMPAMLRHFDKVRIGYPNILRNEYIEKQISDKNIDYDDYLCNHSIGIEEVCNKEWSMILNKMADNFEKLNDLEFKWRRKYNDEREKLKTETFQMFAKWLYCLWD